MGFFDFFKKKDSLIDSSLKVYKEKLEFSYEFDKSEPDDAQVMSLLSECRTEIIKIRNLNLVYVSDLYKLDIDRLEMAINDIEKSCLNLGKYKHVFENTFEENIELLTQARDVLYKIHATLIDEEQRVTDKIADDVLNTSTYNGGF